MLAIYGVVLDIEDYAIFAFRSTKAHGSAFPPHTHNVGYVLCMVVNNHPKQLFKRTIKARYQVRNENQIRVAH